MLHEYTTKKMKGYSNPAGGHPTFISQWSLTKCRYSVWMAVANKVYETQAAATYKLCRDGKVGRCMVL